MRLRVVRTAAALLCAAAVAIIPAPPAHANNIRSDQWHLDFLRISEVHRITRGEGVTVAVIDSGVEPHPDLRDNLLPGIDVADGGSGDGREDHDGHGTAMAGLIAAHGRGGNSGVLGIAPAAKILPIRYETPTMPGGEIGAGRRVAKGIDWAVAQGAKVINLSIGGGPAAELREAVERAIAADVVVVAAVGNRMRVVGYPANYKGVLAVGAVDRNGNRADFSVTGKALAISAPGEGLITTGRNGEYHTSQGTSPATAIVSGAVALIRSKYPELSAEEVIHRLTATATDKGAPGRDPEYGYGVLNIHAALTADIPPLPTTDTATPTPPTEPTIAAPTMPAPDNNATSDNNTSPATTILLAIAALATVGIIIGIPLLLTRRRNTPPSPGT